MGKKKTRNHTPQQFEARRKRPAKLEPNSLCQLCTRRAVACDLRTKQRVCLGHTEEAQATARRYSGPAAGIAMLAGFIGGI